MNFQGWIDQIEYDEDEDEYIYEQANEEHGEWKIERWLREIVSALFPTSSSTCKCVQMNIDTLQLQLHLQHCTPLT